jgi:hypothetical protein
VRIPPGGGDPDHVQAGIPKGDRQRERIINVIADICVNDDGLAHYGPARAGLAHCGLAERESRCAQQADRFRRNTSHDRTPPLVDQFK